MGHKALKVSLIVVLGLFAFTALAGIAAYWRLTMGPLPISFLQSSIENAINAQLSGLKITLADTVLELDTDTYVPSVRARNIVLRDTEGNLLATAPKVGVTLDKAAILEGRVSIRTLELIGPRINAKRNLDGTIELGLDEPAADENEQIIIDENDINAVDAPPSGKSATKPAGGRLLEILGSPGGSGALARLDNIHITRASLRFYDEANDATWTAPRADLTFKRMPYGFLLVAKAEVASAGAPWQAEFSGTYKRDTGSFVLNLAIADLVPANVAEKVFVLSRFAKLGMPFSGRMDMELTANNGVSHASGELFAAAGEFNLPDYFAQPILIDEGAFRFSYDGASDVFSISDSSILVGGSRADVTGKLSPVRSPDGRLTDVGIDLVARNVNVDAQGTARNPVEIDRIEFKGAAAIDDQRVTIDDLVVMAGQTGVRLRGSITGGEESAGIQVAGRLRDVSAKLLKQLWPPILTPKTRAWINENIRDGRITEGTFQVNFPVDQLARTMKQRVMRDGAVDVAFKVDGITSSYFKTLPLLTGASGEAHLKDRQFSLVLDKGTATLDGGESVKLASGTFLAADILQPEVMGDFTFDIEGPVKSMLAFAAHPDLNMAPADVSAAPKLDGTAHALIGLQFPMIKGVPKSRVTVTTKVGITDARVTGVLPGIDLTDGTLAVQSSPEKITVSGPAKINGIASDVMWQKSPGKEAATVEIETTVDEKMRDKLGLHLEDYIDGKVPVKVKISPVTDKGRETLVTADLSGVTMKLAAARWLRGPAKGTKATFKVIDSGKGNRLVDDIAIDGPGLKLRGSIKLQDNEMVRIDATQIQLEEDDVFTATLVPGDGVMNLELTGTALDARPYIKALVSPGKGDSADAQTPKGQNFVVKARFDKVIAHRGEQITGLTANFVTKRGSIASAEIEGVFKSGKPVTVRVTPTEGGRELRVTTVDGGAVLRATDFYGKIAGGELRFYALMSNQPGSPIRNGELVIENFEVRNEAALAELDARGRPKKSGPRRDGIYFRKLNLPFSTDNDLVRLCKVVLRGPDMGATASGLIRKRDGAIDLTGSYFPAYGLNSFVGEIPVLGSLLTGGKREGILGITYAMGGTITTPKYQLNPLSFLAPGILRKLFEYEQNACRNTRKAALN